MKRTRKKRRVQIHLNVGIYIKKDGTRHDTYTRLASSRDKPVTGCDIEIQRIL